MTAAKRTGWIGLSVLALLVALGTQIVASVAVILPHSFIAGIQAAMNGQTDPSLVMENIMADMGGIMGIILVVVGVLLLIVFVPWFYFGCGRQKITGASARRVFAPRTLLLVAIIAIGLNYGINCLLQLVYILVPQVLENYQQLMENAGIGSDVWSNAAAVLLAPLGEELIFRGVAFHYARKAVYGMKNPRAAFWIATCLQALLFGIYHMNLVQGIYAFVIGLALGYLCQKYHSVIPGMLAHLVFNGMSALFGDVMYAWIPEGVVWYAVIGAAAMALVALLILRDGSLSADNEQNVA